MHTLPCFCCVFSGHVPTLCANTSNFFSFSYMSIPPPMLYNFLACHFRMPTLPRPPLPSSSPFPFVYQPVTKDAPHTPSLSVLCSLLHPFPPGWFRLKPPSQLVCTTPPFLHSFFAFFISPFNLSYPSVKRWSKICIRTSHPFPRFNYFSFSSSFIDLMPF